MSIAAPVAQIEVAPAYRPSWYREDAGSHVPLPPASVAVPREVLPGDVIVWGTVEDQRLPLVSVDGGQGYLRYDWDAWQRYVPTERYHTQQRPLYTRLPFHYHRVPGTLRRLVARAMLSGQTPTDGAPSQFP
ncbi:MAG: hypothetical protein VYE68_13305, partial [Acidobacteriota bacterium]|nr:hypothetical protein [Acidobacteriota bacterium]